MNGNHSTFKSMNAQRSLKGSISPSPFNFGLNPITMSFKSPRAELRFRSSYAERSLFVARLTLLLGGLQYLVFAILDLMIMPVITLQDFYSLLMIRLSVFGIILIILGWSLHASFKKYMQEAISIVPLLAGFGVSMMIVIVPNSEVYNQYYVGFILIFIYVHVLLRLRFIYATVVSWILFFMFFAASQYVHTSSAFLINNCFFLIATQFCGMAASYMLEYYDRTVFCQRISLDVQQRELKKEISRKSHELQELRSIQHTLLPARLPNHPAFEIAASMKTASEVGGDYYDFKLSKDGVLTFVIADATGHGAKAGVMVTAAKILFLLLGRQRRLPDTLSRFSRIIKSTGLRQLYMSMALGRITHNTLELAGAGMPSALLWNAQKKEVLELPLKGMPLGSVPSYPYTNIETALCPGDLLFLMSDGLPELSNGNGGMLGYDLPGKFLKQYAHLSAGKLIRSFENEISKYGNGFPLKDDITMIVIKRNEFTAHQKTNTSIQDLNIRPEFSS